MIEPIQSRAITLMIVGEARDAEHVIQHRADPSSLAFTRAISKAKPFILGRVQRWAGCRSAVKGVCLQRRRHRSRPPRSARDSRESETLELQRQTSSATPGTVGGEIGRNASSGDQVRRRAGRAGFRGSRPASGGLRTPAGTPAASASRRRAPQLDPPRRAAPSRRRRNPQSPALRPSHDKRCASACGAPASAMKRALRSSPGRRLKAAMCRGAATDRCR